jgi:hypothetical protein
MQEVVAPLSSNAMTLRFIFGEDLTNNHLQQDFLVLLSEIAINPWIEH